MPIYEYHCGKCQQDFEELIMTKADAAAVKCPNCGKKKLTKKMSGFAFNTGRGDETAGMPLPMKIGTVRATVHEQGGDEEVNVLTIDVPPEHQDPRKREKTEGVMYKTDHPRRPGETYPSRVVPVTFHEEGGDRRSKILRVDNTGQPENQTKH